MGNGIDAERKNLITQQVTLAVVKKARAGETGNNTDVSIFIKDMTEEEKEYAYKEYSRLLLETVYDDNNDKTVSVEEFAKLEKDDLIKQAKAKHENGQALPDELASAERHAYLFAQNLDVNGDGTISIDEFSYFNKEIDVIDDEDQKEQDGKLTVKSSEALFESFIGTNVKDTEHSKKVKEITEKYLSGQNLTEDEQKILNEASTEIRTAVAKRAKEKFDMDLGEAKDQKVYHGDVDQDWLKGGSTGTGGLNSVDPEAMKLLIMNFMQNMFQSNAQIANALTMPGMGGGMGMLGGMMPMGGNAGNTINFLSNPNQNAPQSSGMKAFQWGNILGQGLNFATMLRGVFGGGNFGGGLDWWFRS